MPLVSPKFRYLLFPLALFYWAMIFWRNLFYAVGFFVSRRLPVPVISVGNLSVGGTGKTPAVIYLARRLTEKGYKVAVVSRGYKREGTGTVVVSDGEKIQASERTAGDEPYLTARQLPGTPVIVDEIRYRGGMVAVGRFKPDVVILDDAFQHRALERDVDLVLLNSKDSPEDYKLLPYGRLREPWIHLRRADIIFWTKSNLLSCDGRRGPDPSLLGRAAQWGVPTFTSTSQPNRLLDAKTEKAVSISRIRDTKVFAFCGIADPDSFRQIIQKCGGQIVGFDIFEDHHHYSRTEVENLAAKGESLGAELAVTTEKDVFKVRSWTSENVPLFSLGIHFVPSSEGEKALWALIEKMLGRP
ncbi:MAG: tetraacyldisaccharide 4'-kinase [Fidelibacterota bacterium]